MEKFSWQNYQEIFANHVSDKELTTKQKATAESRGEEQGLYQEVMGKQNQTNLEYILEQSQHDLMIRGEQ